MICLKNVKKKIPHFNKYLRFQISLTVCKRKYSFSFIVRKRYRRRPLTFKNIKMFWSKTRKKINQTGKLFFSFGHGFVENKKPFMSKTLYFVNPILALFLLRYIFGNYLKQYHFLGCSGFNLTLIHVHFLSFSV